MSVQSEITRISWNIAEAFAKIGEMGGSIPSNANSGNLAAAIATIPIGGGGGGGTSEFNVHHGTFTPTDADYASYKCISVPYEGTLVNLTVIDTEYDTTTVDRYRPYMFTCSRCVANGADNSLNCLYYKGSSSSGSLQATTSFNAILFNGSSGYVNANASGINYLINVSGNIARFRTYGNYRFRVGRTYEYWIVSKE